MKQLADYVKSDPSLAERSVSFSKRIRITHVSATMVNSNTSNRARVDWEIGHHIELDEVQADTLKPVLRVNDDTTDKFNYLTQSGDDHQAEIWLPIPMRGVPIGPELQRTKTAFWNEVQSLIMSEHDLSWLHYGTEIRYSLNLSAVGVFPPESALFWANSGKPSEFPYCAYVASIWPHITGDDGEAESLVGLVPPTFQIAPSAGQKVGVPLAGAEQVIEKFLSEVKYAYGCAYALAST